MKGDNRINPRSCLLSIDTVLITLHAQSLSRVTITLRSEYYRSLHFTDGTERLSSLSELGIPALKTFNNAILPRMSASTTTPQT